MTMPRLVPFTILLLIAVGLAVMVVVLGIADASSTRPAAEQYKRIAVPPDNRPAPSLPRDTRLFFWWSCVPATMRSRSLRKHPSVERTALYHFGTESVKRACLE